MDRGLLIDFSLFLVTLALLGTGAFFFGNGLHGKVTSQNCCLDGSCPQSHICDSANAFEKRTGIGSSTQIGIGSLFLLLSCVGVVHFQKKVRKRQKKTWK